MEVVKRTRGISVEKIVKKQGYKPLNSLDLSLEIDSHGIYRPGYEFAGFFQCESDELQKNIHVIGKKEALYIKNLDTNLREERLKKYFSYSFPCVIISSEAGDILEFLEIGTKLGKIILKSPLRTSETIREIKFYLSKVLGAEGVLNGYHFLEIFGIGVLLSGNDNIKIGSTIELLERGHKFIGESNILVKKNVLNQLVGYNQLNRELSNPHFFLDTPGSKIDLTNHFGIRATRTKNNIDLIIHLETWDNKKFYDRLGIDEEYDELLGVKVNKVTLPVKKGRNLAVIIETGAMNLRLKKMGINSAKYFWKESQKYIKNKGGNMSRSEEGVSVEELVDKFCLEVIYGKKHIKNNKITTSSVHKPSLALTGYFEMYEEIGYDGIQVFSPVELNFLNTKLTLEEGINNLKKYFSYKFPLVLLTSNLELPQYLIDIIKESEVVVARTDLERATQIIAVYNSYLEHRLIKSLSVHGVYLELYGFGVLLKGKSGIGKSETALELIHRGHRLVADDFVKFTKGISGEVTGKADKLPYFMEIRGLGIIDIKALYGLGAVRIEKRLDLVIELKESITDEEYLSDVDYISEIEILEKKFDKLSLYISSGRNAAAMVEIAVMNVMAKKMGYDPEKAYEDGLNRLTLQEKMQLGIK